MHINTRAHIFSARAIFIGIGTPLHREAASVMSCAEFLDRRRVIRRTGTAPARRPNRPPPNTLADHFPE